MKCYEFFYSLPDDKLLDFGNLVILPQLESLQQSASAGRHKRGNRNSHGQKDRMNQPRQQHDGRRNIDENKETHLIDQVYVPARQIVGDMATCSFEKFGKSGSTDFQVYFIFPPSF